MLEEHKTRQSLVTSAGRQATFIFDISDYAL